MATYYIKNDGSDNYSGLSDASAWQTIAKVNTSFFNPSDYILFNKGDTWRESLLLPSSGNTNNYIIIGNYGSGDAPKILGSFKAINWAEISTNIWQSDTSLTDPYGGSWDAEIFFEELDGSISWGIHGTGDASLIQKYYWTWADNKISIYSETDPSTTYLAIEIPQRDYCVGLNGKEYLIIDGIQINYFKLAGIYEKDPITELHGLIVKNCHSAYSGIKNGVVGYGFHIFHSDMTVQNNICHDNGRRNISISPSSTSGITFNNIIVENNECYNGFHTTGIDLGHSGNCNFDNVIVRNNYIYQDSSAILVTTGIGIFVKQVSGISTNFYIHNNLILQTSGSAISLEDIDSALICNNTIYGVYPNINFNAGLLQMANQDGSIRVRNNIVYNNLPINSPNTVYCFYKANDDTGTTSDYNLFYDISINRNIVVWNGGYNTNEWGEYVSDKGQDIHSPYPTDPFFVDASSGNFHLQADSSAKWAGVYLPEVLTDYEGNPRHNPPSIGAYEYISESSTSFVLPNFMRFSSRFLMHRGSFLYHSK
jgi:hypothetical protein